MATPNETTLITMRVEVSADQPTRARVAIAGNGGADSPRTRLRWWWGDEPSAPFVVPGVDQNVTLRATPPPGAFQLEVTAGGPVVAARYGSVDCPISVETRSAAVGRDQVVVSTVLLELDEAWSQSPLLLTIATPTDLGTTAGVLTRPLRWMTRDVGVDRLEDWATWGLSDFSGTVHYSTMITCNDAASARLAICGLVGSARVTLNGTPIGTIYSTDSSTPCELVAGANSLEIECANTLVNYYSRWPSPYSHVQQPGGGFLSVKLETLTPSHLR